MFASENLAGKVVSYEVIENPEILALSDHNPLVVTFDLEEREKNGVASKRSAARAAIG